MTENTSNLKLQRWIFVSSIILLAGKFSAFILTYSNAVLTDAMESIVNVVASGIGLYSLWLSAKPRDTDHPYGHGKIEFISASIEGTMVLVAGLIIVGKSVHNIFYPQDLHDLDIGIAILFGTAVANYMLGFISEKQGNKTDSPALIASGKHLKTDAWSTAGIVSALLLIYLTGLAWLDIVIAIGFGGFISITGYKVWRKAVGGIMDEADYDLLSTIISRVNEHRREPWMDLHNMRVIKYGSVLHIDCHLTVPWYFTIREGHNEVDRLEALIKNELKNPVELFIHTDYCVPPFSCTICIMSNCNVREAVFQKRIEWDLKNVLQDKKHGL
ncbi:MAG: cation transporter [Chitinophagales bacterium]|nr:cation transporter [Chitinophagales bacterium]